MLSSLVCACTKHGAEAKPFSVDARVDNLIAGREFTCVAHVSGEVSCWGKYYATPVTLGKNDVAQLAIGSTSSPRTGKEPVCILDHQGNVECDFRVPEMSDVSDISIGYDHACAVLPREDRVTCWEMSLELLPESHQHIPDAVEVAVAREHACALTRSGDVICWDLEDHFLPKWMVGFGTGVDISARVDICVADVEGVVRCLAPSDGSNPMAPERVASVKQATTVAAGYTMNCAVSGTHVGCWPVSQPHDRSNDAARVAEPVDFPGNATVDALAVGSEHACVVTSTSIQCWGGNHHHQLDGRQVPVVEPRRVANLDEVTEIAVGSHQSCARERDGAVHCWGMSLEPDGSWSGMPSRIARLEGMHLFQDRNTGLVGARADGRPTELLTWRGDEDGWNEFGYGVLPGGLEHFERGEFNDAQQQLVCGISSARPPVCAIFARSHPDPTTPPQVLEGVGDIAMCFHRVWVLDDDGGVSLADPVDRKVIRHVRSVDLPAPATDVACAALDACALLQDGSVACWSESEAQPRSFPHEPIVIALERPATAIAMAPGSACAVRDDQRVECWGDVEVAPLAYASPRSSAESPRVLPGVVDAVQVSLDLFHGCVLHADGGVSCWGSNAFGQVGGTSPEWKSEPVEISLDPSR